MKPDGSVEPRTSPKVATLTLDHVTLRTRDLDETNLPGELAGCEARLSARLPVPGLLALRRRRTDYPPHSGRRSARRSCRRRCRPCGVPASRSWLLSGKAGANGVAYSRMELKEWASTGSSYARRAEFCLSSSFGSKAWATAQLSTKHHPQSKHMESRERA